MTRIPRGLSSAKTKTDSAFWRNNPKLLGREQTRELAEGDARTFRNAGWKAKVVPEISQMTRHATGIWEVWAYREQVPVGHYLQVSKLQGREYTLVQNDSESHEILRDAGLRPDHDTIIVKAKNGEILEIWAVESGSPYALQNNALRLK